MTRMKMIMETNSAKHNDWWENDWYKKQEELNKQELEKNPPKQIPRWICLLDNNGELKFEYVNI